MQLVVPASGIYGATIYRGYYYAEYNFATRLYLSSFSLTIGTENLGLQNLQRPSTVNVSMQVTSIETCYYGAAAKWGDSKNTPWARSVRIPWNPNDSEKQIDYNELYVVLKPNQGYYYPILHNSTLHPTEVREEYQIIKVTDIKFDIPEYSAVSRSDSATLNTFTINGVADAREPVLIGPATKDKASWVVGVYPITVNGPQWPRSTDTYAILQTGDVYNEQNTNNS